MLDKFFSPRLDIVTDSDIYRKRRKGRRVIHGLLICKVLKRSLVSILLHKVLVELCQLCAEAVKEVFRRQEG